MSYSLVVHKQHVGQTDSSPQIPNYAPHFLDALYVSLVTQALDQSGNSQMRGHLIRLQHILKTSQGSFMQKTDTRDRLLG